MAFKQEEEWIPISDWGRSMKSYLDQVKVKAVMVTKPKAKRQHVYRPRPRTGRPPGHQKGVPFTSSRKCAKCDTCIRSDNKYGLCQKHTKQQWQQEHRAKLKAAA